ncbi:MAG TPA: efflux RND transporter periplasmic adaptor subunit [Candidatus Tumulicola sp.]|nr:efflux RND transporter periplasmic adaptor subunit [Candidatus Tumulicola sp.]
MTAQVDKARVTLALSPDPPQTGTEHVRVTVDGIPADRLTKTQMRFDTSMPTMSMVGTGGTAIAVAGKPGQWTFDLATGMATEFIVTLHFDGGLKGTAPFNFAVAGAASQGGGMAAMSGGHEDAWRAAAFALAILLALGALAAWLVTRSLNRSGRLPGWLNRSTVTLAAVAVVVVIGAALAQSRFAAPSMDMAAMSNVPGTAPVPVTLARAQGSSQNPAIAAPGMIQALYTQDVVARAPGILRDFTAYNGTRVFAGETLAILEEPELGAQAVAAQAGASSDAAAAAAAMIEAHHHAPNAIRIAQADAAAKAQRANYWRAEMQREQMLLKNGAVSQQEYDDEQAQAAAAYADAESARRQQQDAVANLEMAQQQAVSAQQRAASSGASAQAAAVMAGYTRIVSPDDAIVVKRLVDPGTYVQVGTPVLRLAVIGKARIQASVAQDDLQSIRLGAVLDASLPDGRVVHARVTSVQPAADPTTHTALVEAIVDNPGGHLVPGTYVRVIIRGAPSHARNAVSVPSAAVIGAGVDAAVWVDVNSTAHRVPVRIISDDGTTAQVAGDLKSGDRVVVEGAADLEEGMPIAERTS